MDEDGAMQFLASHGHQKTGNDVIFSWLARYQQAAAAGADAGEGRARADATTPRSSSGGTAATPTSTPAALPHVGGGEAKEPAAGGDALLHVDAAQVEHERLAARRRAHPPARALGREGLGRGEAELRGGPRFGRGPPRSSSDGFGAG